MEPEHERVYSSCWAAIQSADSMAGCTAKALRSWLEQHEIEADAKTGQSTEEQTQLKVLQEEVKEFQKFNEMLRSALAISVHATRNHKLK